MNIIPKIILPVPIIIVTLYWGNLRLYTIPLCKKHIDHVRKMNSNWPWPCWLPWALHWRMLRDIGTNYLGSHQERNPQNTNFKQTPSTQKYSFTQKSTHTIEMTAIKKTTHHVKCGSSSSGRHESQLLGMSLFPKSNIMFPKYIMLCIITSLLWNPLNRATSCCRKYTDPNYTKTHLNSSSWYLHHCEGHCESLWILGNSATCA